MGGEPGAPCGWRGRRPWKIFPFGSRSRAEATDLSNLKEAQGTMEMSGARRRLLGRLGNPRLRGREKAFLVEGVRGVKETLQARIHLDIRFALVSPRLTDSEAGGEVLSGLEARSVPVEEISEEEMVAVSGTEHPQGVLLVVREPGSPRDFLERCSSPRALFLDGVQDPGNAGTLVRAARAFGLDAVFFLEGSVDPWNPKVVRSMAGAFAHLPILRARAGEALVWLREKGLPLYVADIGGEDVRGIPVADAWGLVLGNEGSGPRATLARAASRVLTVPMTGGTDSLNVAMAGSILMFALSPSLERRAGD